MAEKILKLYKYVDGVNDTPFPNAEQQVEICEFTYEAQRMGTSPSITATVMYPSCLDNLWSPKVYAEFNGEKYYVTNTPSSSKDNSDQRYKHEVVLLSERDKLNHIYFIDAVQDNPDVDKYKSNSLNVIFYGGIEELASRLNDAMSYANLDYTVVIDEGITSEEKLIEFENKRISEVLEEIYNTFEIPYYFVGKLIHIGYTDNAIPTVFKYGATDALLSANKNNANYEVINRITGIGSTDNLPYYYPNLSAKGEVLLKYGENNTGLKEGDVTISNYKWFSDKIGSMMPISYREERCSGGGNGKYQRGNKSTLYSFDASKPFYGSFNNIDDSYKFYFHLSFQIQKGDKLVIRLRTSYVPYAKETSPSNLLKGIYAGSMSSPVAYTIVDDMDYESATITINGREGQYFPLIFYVELPVNDYKWQMYFSTSCVSNVGWFYDNKQINLDDYGLSIKDTAKPEAGDYIYQEQGSYIPHTENLMPSIYRETLGAQRFYNAINDKYQDDEGNYYVFETPYSPTNIREGFTEFTDIKPTIKGMTNAAGERIDTILDVAFDANDDDSFVEENDNEYSHPYFFVKLRKFDGEYGFNLFDHAIEQQAMQISLTSGACGACTFEIGVGEETQKNTVQVDDNGDLLRDEDGNVRCGRKGLPEETPQDRQNDTMANEVWIALKKEDSTYGQLMPNATQKLRPKTGDSFVILGIDLPQAYIENAEKELEKALIRYMAANNMEKYNFSIKFSRIYFEEHPEVASVLNENSRIIVEYNGVQIPLYVNSFTYKIDSSSPLPEIDIELDEDIAVSKNSLQQTVENITSNALYGSGGADFLRQALPYFLRKDVPDSTVNLMRFLGGIITDNLQSSNFMSGLLGYGFSLKNSNGLSQMEVDELLVRTKAIFNELSIMETELLGASFMFNPTGAWIKVSRVENLTLDGVDVYRCYFVQDDGERSVDNRFIIGNQARSQSFNINSGTYENVSNHFYWRLVTSAGKDFIDLSVDDCAEGSDVPAAGDIIVQVGDRENVDYQSVIVISAFGDNAPYITFYNGVNSYTFEGKDIFSIGYDKEKQECYFRSYGRFYAGNRETTDFVKYTEENGLEVAGKVTVKPGSVGVQNFSDLPESIQEAVKVGGENLLLNTSFSGDYESIHLMPSTELEPASDMYSPKLVSWTGTGEVRDDAESASGYSCKIGGISQLVNVIRVEHYVISLRAKGSNFTVSCGGFTKQETLTDEYQQFTYNFQPDGSPTIFMITGDATICELKLERGTIRTDWTPSYFDTDPVGEKFKSLWPIVDALRGNTQTIGGLTLSSMMMLGQWVDGQMKKVTGGMSGICNDRTEVAFWAGGDYQAAYETVRKFRNNEQISDEEWNSLAKFVVLHSGDVFMRGYVYAEGGYFRGDIYAENGFFDGVVQSKYNMPYYKMLGTSMISGNEATSFIVNPEKTGTRFIGWSKQYDAVDDYKDHLIYLPEIPKSETGIIEVHGFSPAINASLGESDKMRGLTFAVNPDEAQIISNGQSSYAYCRIIAPGHATLLGFKGFGDSIGIWYVFGLNVEYTNDLSSWPIDTEDDDYPTRPSSSHLKGGYYYDSTRRQ